jgi:hypothetical protein
MDERLRFVARVLECSSARRREDGGAVPRVRYLAQDRLQDQNPQIWHSIWHWHAGETYSHVSSNDQISALARTRSEPALDPLLTPMRRGFRGLKI